MDDLLTHESLNVIRHELVTRLKAAYLRYTNAFHGRDIKYNWVSWHFQSSGMLKLTGPVTPAQAYSQQELRSFLNKPTTFYWAHSAQTEHGACRLYPFAAIYKQWFRYHDNRPNFLNDHFFANPVQISSTGPTSITEICEAHRLLCARASLLLETIINNPAKEDFRDHWEDPEDYKLLPLCRAIMIILDDEQPPDFDHRVFLDKEAERLNVVIVRTGDEDGLSAPIDFSNIRSESLPLARSDISTDAGEATIRVSLKTAIKFILDLERREQAVFPSLYPGRSNVEDQSDAYAERKLDQVEDMGIANVPAVKDALLDILRGREEPSQSAEFDFWSPNWL